jgi:hypothetical protein
MRTLDRFISVVLTMVAAALSSPSVAQTAPPPPRIFDPSRNHVVVFVEGGASFGHSTLAVDPGAFVPVRETLGGGQRFVGGGVEFEPIDGLNLILGSAGRNFSSYGRLIVAVDVRRFFDDDIQRSFNAGGVSGDVKQAAEWSVTSYIGFPQEVRVPGLERIPMTATPVFGITYEWDTVRSAQASGAMTNIFDKSFGRVGGMIGLNLDVPAGNFSYGLRTGLTMLPSTTVNGTSSLGLPAQAKIDSQANLYVAGRISVRLFPGATVDLVPPR